MEFVKAQKFVARVSDKYFLAENERYLFVKLELVTPDIISFVAGQYVSIKVNEQGMRRSYSVVSSPDDDHGVNLVAAMIPEGLGTGYLRKLKPGDEVEVLGPLGRFVVNETSPEVAQSKLLFVATGSGIAPIWSMINDLLINKRESRQVRLHWGMRSEQELFWVDNWERLAEAHQNFVFDIVLSQPSEEWELCNGHVQDCLKRDFVKEGLREWEGYVCGNPEMVDEVTALLPTLGMNPANIYHEKFT